MAGAGRIEAWQLGVHSRLQEALAVVAVVTMEAVAVVEAVTMEAARKAEARQPRLMSSQVRGPHCPVK